MGTRRFSRYGVVRRNRGEIEEKGEGELDPEFKMHRTSVSFTKLMEHPAPLFYAFTPESVFSALPTIS